jgi:hypothetical protein
MTAAAKHLREFISTARIDERDRGCQSAEQEWSQHRISSQFQELCRVADFQNCGVDVRFVLGWFGDGQQLVEQTGC